MITRTFPAMGGTIELQLVHGSDADVDRIASLFSAYEHTMSRFLPDSELCALNASHATPFAASPLLFDVVSEAAGWAAVTDGIFDPTVIDALEASGYNRPFDEIAAGGGTAVATRRVPATRTQRWRRIRFDYEHETITLPADVRVDLGGIGKGYTVDRAIAALGPGVNAMVNASGDLYAAGDGPGGDGWYIGVADPFDAADDITVLNINDRGVATSGSVRRNWLAGDARYHHLIDTREGTSSRSGLATVTVVALTATQADILAKTAFLLGVDDGVRMIERFPGAECLAVTQQGDVLTSPGMAEYLA